MIFMLFEITVDEFFAKPGSNKGQKKLARICDKEPMEEEEEEDPEKEYTVEKVLEKREKPKGNVQYRVCL